MGTKLERFSLAFLFALPLVLSLFFSTPGTSLAGTAGFFGGPDGLSSGSPSCPFLLCSFGSISPSMPRLHRAGPYAGEFLVATRQLTDSVFSETVILLIEYGSDGAMGLIINRPSKVPVSKLFPEIKDLKKRNDLAYIGGPVELYEAFLLLNSKSKNPPGQALRIFDGVYISPDMQALRKMVADPKAKFRIYAGYAGWASGQLETEISRGDWYILPADEKTLFDMPASEIWPDLIDRAGIEAMNKNGCLTKPLIKLTCLRNS